MKSILENCKPACLQLHQKGRHCRCFPVKRFCHSNFFGSYHSKFCSDMFYKMIFLKRRLTVQHLRQSFFFDKVVHDQACNFIEKKLQHRCFTVNFTKLLKALCRTPSVSASNFNLTLLNPQTAKDVYLRFPGLLKIKIFQNKGYEVIILDYDVTNKILSRHSNFIVDVVMSPKFGNSSISIREVIITTILYGFDQKNYFFCGRGWWSCLKFNNWGLALGMTLNFYTNVAKG